MVRQTTPPKSSMSVWCRAANPQIIFWRTIMIFSGTIIFLTEDIIFMDIFLNFINITITLTERSSGWKPCYKLEMLKLVFKVSSEYQGCHSDDNSFSVYNYKKDFQDHFNIIHLRFNSMFMLIKSGNKMWNWWQGLDAIKVQNWHLKSCDDKPENIHTIHLWSPWKPEHVIHNNGAQKSQRYGIKNALSVGLWTGAPH